MRSKEEILNDFKVCCSNDSCNKCSYCVCGVCSDGDNGLEEEIIELIESDTDYNKGMEDAWEIARKVFKMDAKDIYKCFNIDLSSSFYDVINKLTVFEVKEKLEEWERNKFYIGDIVYSGTNENKDICGIVVTIHREQLEVLTDNRTIEICLKKDMKKTGKHLDIDSLFKQIEELSV